MSTTNLNIPSKLPLLYIQNGVVLPGVSVRFKISSPTGVALIKSRLLNRSTLASTLIGIIPADPDTNEEKYEIGTASLVVQVSGTNWPRREYTILVTGIARIRVSRITQYDPFYIGQVETLARFFQDEPDDEVENDVQELVEKFRRNALTLLELLDLSVPAVAKLSKMLENAPNHQLADIISALVNASFKEKVEVLNAVKLHDRFTKALPLLLRQIEGLQTLRNSQEKRLQPSKKTDTKVRHRGGRNFLDENNDDSDEIDALEAKLQNSNLPENVEKVAFKELKRIRKMSPQMPEYPMLRHYLELISDLPWNESTIDTIDMSKAREDLDSDHYAMNEVKKRILEYLAVRKLKNSLRGPILCFVGPPGVGKTSIGKSIANTLGRKFQRISLGGVSDQSDIRGHRRTYIGSMPGRFIQGLKNAGVNNPVFLLDEIDKMTSGIHGDPSAALLEVLDPEQNFNFVDHYLNLPFDLSQVIFIATANSLGSIPKPLRDRMEIIPIPGYTLEDKIPIAKLHLFPKQLKMHGISQDTMQITDNGLRFLTLNYTREAGVRDLERKLGGLCRSIAVKIAESEAEKSSSKSSVKNMKLQDDERQLANLTSNPPNMPMVLDENSIEEILGHPLYEKAPHKRLGHPGVAVGLAWTSVGGEVLVVEATKMRGNGELVLTGQLGEVMKESATLALSWIRSNAAELGIKSEQSLLENIDVHIHFPEGAIGKDGPSAGITITTALVSLFTEKSALPDLAMTGEITLRGIVLPVGGIKEKIIAAHRSGFQKVLIPSKNAKDLKELPKHIKDSLDIILVSCLEEVLENAFEHTFEDLAKKLDTLSKL